MPSKRPLNDEPGPEGFTQGVGEFDLPKAVVQRVVKQGLSDSTIKVQQDVTLALVKSATVYINYVASASFEQATAANRKTITAPDVIRATTNHLRGIGGDSHAADELEEILETELQAFREIQASIKAAKAQGGPAGGPKRGFPGKAKKEVSVGGEEEEQVEADIAVTGNDGAGEVDGDEAEFEEHDEGDEEQEEQEEHETEDGAGSASEEDTEMK
ncbi:hypothetical protein QFC21_002434 [Naganishia friedmannii]|uniref:Uncharacterized protein n=1 Tax=Naganishia friedmannii TaxID=89922 RepID=A0ACC2VXX7_9TREE|nr:hypothetical protein QFC21_002434 [Naganishia friedmannii]